MKNKKYIYLKVGDLVEDGDKEFSFDPLDDTDCPKQEWRPVAAEFIGEYVQEVDPPVRRLIKK